MSSQYPIGVSSPSVSTEQRQLRILVKEFTALAAGKIQAYPVADSRSRKVRGKSAVRRASPIMNCPIGR